MSGVCTRVYACVQARVHVDPSKDFFLIPLIFYLILILLTFDYNFLNKCLCFVIVQFCNNHSVVFSHIFRLRMASGWKYFGMKLEKIWRNKGVQGSKHITLHIAFKNYF